MSELSRLQRAGIATSMLVVVAASFFVGTELAPIKTIEHTIYKDRVVIEHVDRVRYETIIDTEEVERLQKKNATLNDALAKKSYDNQVIQDLEQLAMAENLPVYYISFEAMAELQHLYGYEHAIAGFHYDDKIIICIDFYDVPFVLAHELGHQFAIVYEDNHTEERATEIARELLAGTSEYN